MRDGYMAMRARSKSGTPLQRLAAIETSGVREARGWGGHEDRYEARRAAARVQQTHSGSSLSALRSDDATTSEFAADSLAGERAGERTLRATGRRSGWHQPAPEVARCLTLPTSAVQSAAGTSAATSADMPPMSAVTESLPFDGGGEGSGVPVGMMCAAIRR